MGGTRARLDRLASHLTTDGLRAWRSTPFRLTLIYGTAFIVAIIVLLGAVYGQTADFLIRRVDGITRAESSRLAALRPEDLPAAIRLSIANDHLRLNSYGLFSPDGQRIEGDGPELPAGNPRDQTPRELVDHDGRSVRVIARVLPWGEVLLVGRDTTQLVELRRVLLNSLLWSGGAIAVVGFTAGVLLSRRSLRRLAQRRVQRQVHRAQQARLPDGRHRVGRNRHAWLDRNLYVGMPIPHLHRLHTADHDIPDQNR